MADELLSALDRAEQALERIERTLAHRPNPSDPGRDEQLRATVRDVVQELDQLIRKAAA